MARPRVVVVGSGVTGLAAARELARAGCEPTVLGHVGSSQIRPPGFDLRLFSLAHRIADDVRDAAEARVLWRRLERDTDTTLLSRYGSLDLGAVLTETRASLGESGVDFDLLDAADFPEGVRPLTDDEVALYQRHGATINATQVKDTMTRDAIENGARFDLGTQVSGLRLHGSGIRLLAGREVIDAQVVVLAAGPWTPELVAQYEDEVDAPTTATTVVQTAVRMAGEWLGTAAIPVIVERRDDGTEFRLTSSDDRTALIATIDPRIAAAPDSPVDTPDPRLVAEAADWVRARVAGMSEQVSAAAWVATHVADERFQLVCSGRLISAVSCAGRGYTFAPIVGARAAALAHEALNS